MDDPLHIRPLAGSPPYSLSNKLMRVVWQVVWLIGARWTPPPFWAWRRFLLKAFGATVGKGSRIHASVSVWHPARLVVGENALIGPGARLYNQGHIAIGANSVVSQRAHLCASTHDIADPLFALSERPIIVGRGCWIAAEAFVGPGVTVHDGAVLGARAALFTDAERMTVYRGNPAMAIGPRRLRERPSPSAPA